ncbi:MAG: two-component regulator propeller domain-containing protein [Bacteroidales bacterium]|jgi:hypothetical protein
MYTQILRTLKQKKHAIMAFFLISTFSFQVNSQTVDYGLWRDHFPYNSVKSVLQKDAQIYAATPYSIMIYDNNDNSIRRLNKVMAGGLSDINISDIALCKQLNSIIVAYSNTNIDIIKNDRIINISDIYRKSILGNKTINSIFIKGKNAYLACGFGIVVLDIEREEIKDTYYIGSEGSQINVYDIAFSDTENKFYAATEAGLLTADASSNLAYFNNWKADLSLNEPNAEYNFVAIIDNSIITNIVKPQWADDTIFIKQNNSWEVLDYSNLEPKKSFKVCNNKFVVASYSRINIYSSTGQREETIRNYNPGVIAPNDAIIDSDNNIWVADENTGLRKIRENDEAEKYIFNGPDSPKSVAIDYRNGSLCVVAGGKDGSFGNIWNQAELFQYTDRKWSSYTRKDFPQLDSIRDFVSVAINPSDKNHIYAGSWGYGLFEFKDGQLIDIHNNNNSTLQFMSGSNYIRIGGLKFDDNNNLWVTNSGAGNLLSARKPNGQWISYNLGEAGSGYEIAGIAIDHAGNKWIQMRDNNLLVFSDNNTLENNSDDRGKKLTNAVGNGALPSAHINCIEIDKTGQLWLGTDEGVYVIYSPSSVFTGGNYDAQNIKVERDGAVYNLLETEIVTAIAINGNNEKWFGTNNSGAFLMSEDGTEEILHFTAENSPLISNQIMDIKISNTGEVFFATALGVISYQDYKVEPLSHLDSLYIYPNPVRPNYNGPIMINNLVGSSHIKITDANDNLVWETENNGGQALWYGTDIRGRKVNSGVYYIYVISNSLEHRKAGKVLIIR